MINILEEQAASIFTLTKFGSDRHWSEWKKEMGCSYLKGHRECGELESQAGEEDPVQSQQKLREILIPMFWRNMLLWPSGWLSQFLQPWCKMSPLFFPLSWWATFLAAFPCNWLISSSQSLQCLPEPNSVTLKREAALPLKHLYQHSLWSYTVSQSRWLSFVQNVP